jgi:methylmalonyl-CoA mutase cobalamin-binding domain/chain
MNDITPAAKLELPEQPKLANKVRFVTAASLFDGHDASINIMRRILQSNGAEVVHLGHNRSVDDVVTAALAEDVQGIAISSYQGGHVEYFKYMIDLLRQRGGAHIKVFGGGGGVIVPERDRRAACLRRDAHLQPGRRPAHGPGRHDPLDAGSLRHRFVALRPDLARAAADRRDRTAPPSAGPADHRAGKRQGVQRAAQADHGQRPKA